MYRRSQRGQSMVEYALAIVLVAVVAMGILGLVGNVAQGSLGIAVGALRGSGASSASSASLTFAAPVTCKQGVSIHVVLSTTLPLTELSLRNNAPDWHWQGYPIATDFTSGLAPNYSCPTSVVVQHRASGAIAAAGVVIIP